MIYCTAHPITVYVSGSLAGGQRVKHMAVKILQICYTCAEFQDYAFVQNPFSET